MANSSILEEMLEHLVNENRTQAEELFHDYVVAKSREIYESLLEESYSDDEAGDDEYEEAFDFGKSANDDDFGDDEEEGEDDDQFGEKEFGDEEEGEEGSKEEIFQSLDEIVDELQAKFDELRGLTGAANDDDAGFGGDATDELNTEFDDSEDENESFELETVREYVEKVGTDWGKSPKMGDNGANAKSIVAGKNDMGGTTANLKGGTSETGGTQGGLVNPKAQDLKSGNINVPGGKAGDAFKKAAAPKKADDGANSTSLFRNKRQEANVRTPLTEHLSFDQAHIVLEHSNEGDQKSLHLNGICIQGDIKNANQRVYSSQEIGKAVKTLNEQISGGYSVLGEVDHPADLRINLDRVSHMITKMWMDGPNGYGKLKILPTPMGKLIETMLEAGVKLGVSSRGSGDVDNNGYVQGFEIITVDIVAQPSAPGAYPTPVYEHIMNAAGGNTALRIAQEVQGDPKAQKYISESLMRIIKGLN